MPNYILHLNSSDKGKGIATYYKENIFRLNIDIKEDNMQLTKFTSYSLDIIVLYRSKQGNLTNLSEYF